MGHVLEDNELQEMCVEACDRGKRFTLNQTKAQSI